MRAWPPVERPALPGQGQPVRLHDTASGELRLAASDRTARLYVCGITPYDATHVGHAATYVAFDLLYRAWCDSGHDVHYVQNVTDIDDPLLERAAEIGEDWAELAERDTELFRADMAALRVLPPRDYVGAVESIPAIVETIEGLRERGAAYEVDRDIYFPVSSDPHFGAVSGLPTRTMLESVSVKGGDPERLGKKDPLDPLLWRAARPGEPSWESRLGRGRPGWHVECTTIALTHLGDAFDVQGGGCDLVFPHHEMSASHGQVLTCRWPFARLYVHAGMVGLDGDKMSKSQGNLVFVSDLRRDGVDPAAIRLALLAHHYRGNWNWKDRDLPDAQDRLARWRAAAALPTGPPADGVIADVRAALAVDLNAPMALAAVDRWAANALATGGEDAEAPALVAATVDALLGVDISG